MIITIHTKDILFTEDTLIAHCCNTQHTMGSGVAKVLRTTFPEVFAADAKAYITYGKDLLGRCEIVPITQSMLPVHTIKFVANLYAQPNYGYVGRHVDYEAFYQSLESLRNQIKPMGVTSISMPYKIASDRAGGDWEVIQAMLKSVFTGSGINLNLYKLN